MAENTKIPKSYKDEEANTLKNWSTQGKLALIQSWAMYGLSNEEIAKKIDKVVWGLVLIIAGTLLLMLPVSSRDGRCVGFLNALFTSTSASCVTGLVVVDTWSQ